MRAPHYRPAIDSLRAYAAIAVALSHWVSWGAWRINWGFAGVALFFVISGYVMTRAYAGVFRTRMTPGAILLFYWRRALRIFPAFYLALALYAYTGNITPGAFWYHATFTNNIAMIQEHRGLAPIHFWSIALEQQFYLIFPFVMMFLMRRENAVVQVFAVILTLGPLSYALYVASGHNFQLLLFNPISCLGPLLAGMLAAQAERQADRYRRLVDGAGALGLCLFGMMLLISSAADILNHTAVALIGLWLLYNRNFERSPLALLDRAPLRYFGRISYGFYLYHLLIGGIVFAWLGPVEREVFAAAAATVTLLAAAASWHWFEQPLIRLGRAMEPKLPSAGAH
jgi:peptidoglycan/LPS O-acetylase OafA/YrhL